MSTVLATHFVGKDDGIKQGQTKPPEPRFYVHLGLSTVFVDDLATADRISRAFSELAEAMRARQEIPAPVDAALLEPVEL